MASFVWPADDGWPYPDGGTEVTDLGADLDDDVLSLRTSGSHLLDELDDTERQVITARYGLDGQPPRSVKQLRAELGLSPTELRQVLGSGLEKLRSRLRD